MPDESATDLIIRMRTEGADQAAREIEKTGEKVKETKDELEKHTESSHSLMGEQLGSLRTAHHLFEGIKEISEGGGVAIAGLATEARVFGEVFEEALGPIGPELVIISTLLSVGLASAFRETKKEGKDAAKDIADAFSTSKEAIDDTLKTIKENNAFDNLSEKAKEFTAELNIQEQNVRTLQAALDRLADAQFGAQEAALNRQEQVELQGKTGEDAEAIKLKYEKQLEALRGEHEQDKADRALKAKQAELLDLQNQVDAIKAEQTAASAGVANSYARTRPGATGASLGLSDYQYAQDVIDRLTKQQEAHEQRQLDTRTPEASYRGDIMPALTPEERIKLQEAQRAAPELRKTEVTSGPQYTEQIKSLNAEKERLQKEEEEQLKTADEGGYEKIPGETQEKSNDYYSNQITSQFSKKFDEVDQLIAAFTASQEGQDETRKKIDEAVKSYTEAKNKLENLEGADGTGGQIAAAQKDVEAAQVAVKTAQTNAQAKAQEISNKVQAQAQNQSDELRKDARQTEEDRLQNLINAPGTDKTLKSVYDRELKADKAQDITDQAQIKERGETLEPELKKATQTEATVKAEGINPPAVVVPAGPTISAQSELDRSRSQQRQTEDIAVENTVNTLAPLENAAGTTKKAAGELAKLLDGLQNHTIQVGDFVQKVVELTTHGLSVQASQISALKQQLDKLTAAHNQNAGSSGF